MKTDAMSLGKMPSILGGMIHTGRKLPAVLGLKSEQGTTRRKGITQTSETRASTYI